MSAKSGRAGGSGRLGSGKPSSQQGDWPVEQEAPGGQEPEDEQGTIGSCLLFPNHLLIKYGMIYTFRFWMLDVNGDIWGMRPFSNLTN